MQVAPATTVVIQQGPMKPNNYMVLAVLTTFFCNPLFGCIAWILSCVSDSAYDEGNKSDIRCILAICQRICLLIVFPMA